MAYICEEMCLRCDAVTVHTNGNCNLCAFREAERHEREEQLRWDRLTTNEQIAELCNRVKSLEKRLNESDEPRRYI